MRPFILIAAMLALVGCQTVDDFIGTGPITLSSSLSKHYQDKYLKGVGPQYYIVSADGRYANYTYCAAGTGQCTFGLVVLDQIDACEKRSSQKCFIFDQGSYVVWKGPVNYGGSASRRAPIRFKNTLKESMPNISTSSTSKNSGPLSEISDLGLCTLAASGGAWKTDAGSQAYVVEAKSRNLTAANCTPNTSQSVASSNSTRTTPIPSQRDWAALAAMPDKALCGQSTDGPYWLKGRSYSDYVKEAKSRGLTPEKCWNLTN